jgi:hypothetical protein
MPLSESDIRYAFRLILGREPEDGILRDRHFSDSSVDELRLTLLRSEEFQSKYKPLVQEDREHPYGSWDRPTVAYIHLQKTGGTTVDALLRPHFPTERACPVRDDNLHLFTVAELGRFDFYSGSFDLAAVRFIPRGRVKTVSLFRDPRTRLISHYRFHISHPPRDEFAETTLSA